MLEITVHNPPSKPINSEILRFLIVTIGRGRLGSVLLTGMWLLQHGVFSRGGSGL